MVKVTLIRGDGIGPEVVAAAVSCIEAAGVAIEWDEQPAGESAIEQFDTPLPQQTLESIRKNKYCLKGPLTTPVGKGYRSINVTLRQTLVLFANLRPAKLYPGVQSPYAGKPVDLVVVRENTEDLYAGIEFAAGSDGAKKLIASLPDAAQKKIAADSAISIKPISFSGSSRIAEFAFHYAEQHGRKKVHAVHKANIMKFSDGLFLEACRKVAERHPKIAFGDLIVDNAAMQLVKKPLEYDVLVCPNLYGDILSDLCAGLVGGLGVAPSANIGENAAIFEPVHGSAPKHAGQNKVNPCSTILSGVLMLRQLGEKAAADKLEAAVAAVLKEGKAVTYDLAASPEKAVGTKEMAAAIVEKVHTVKK